MVFHLPKNVFLLKRLIVGGPLPHQRLLLFFLNKIIIQDLGPKDHKRTHNPVNLLDHHVVDIWVGLCLVATLLRKGEK